MHKAEAPVCRAMLLELKRHVSRGDGVPCIRPENLPFAAEMRARGSESARELYRKVGTKFERKHPAIMEVYCVDQL